MLAHFVSKHRRLTIPLGVLLMVMIAASTALYFNYRELKKYSETLIRYQHYRTDDGVLGLIARGKIRRGHDIATILEIQRPDREELIGDWAILRYAPPMSFGGLVIVCYRGKLEYAEEFSCTYVDKLIDISPDREADFLSMLALRDRLRDWEYLSKATACACVTGVAVMVGFDDEGKAQLPTLLED